MGTTLGRVVDVMLVFQTSYISFGLVFFSLASLFFLFRTYQYIFGNKQVVNQYEVYFTIFMFIGSLIVPIGTVLDIYQVQKAIDSNLVEHITGKTEKFMYDTSTDSFIVNGIKFKYTKGGNSVYYGKIRREGGLIRKNNQKVKIDYIEVDGENRIIKLWVYE